MTETNFKCEVVGCEFVGKNSNGLRLHSNSHSGASPVIQGKGSAEPAIPMVQISQEAWNKVQEQLKMLTEVADKGRMFNYESNQPKKKAMKVKLSLFAGGILIGWQTIKDVLINNPTTGKIMGEQQEYELKILKEDGTEQLIRINGYPQFSDARYNERVEVSVIGKKEDYEGRTFLDVQLPDNRVITLDIRFVN